MLFRDIELKRNKKLTDFEQHGHGI